jgi:hypothetical protein
VILVADEDIMTVALGGDNEAGSPPKATSHWGFVDVMAQGLASTHSPQGWVSLGSPSGLVRRWALSYKVCISVRSCRRRLAEANRGNATGLTRQANSVRCNGKGGRTQVKIYPGVLSPRAAFAYDAFGRRV